MNHRPHRYARRDANHAQVTADLQAAGFEVYDISTVPDAQCPGDILVYGHSCVQGAHVWQPFEVKRPDGGKASNALQVTNNERVPWVTCAEDVLRWYGRLVES